MNLKKLIGSCIIVILSSNFVYSQCLGIRELVGLYDNETSYLSDRNFSFNERISVITFKGTTINSIEFNSYTGNDNSSKIISDFSGYLEYNTQSSSCFTSVKAQVAKEVGNKVHPKQVSESNGWIVESYEHLTKNLFIQFHKSAESSVYKVVLISTEKFEFIQNLIYKIERQKEIDNNVYQMLVRARDYLENKKFDEAESEIREAKIAIQNQEVSSNISEEVNSFFEELRSTRFHDFRSEIYKAIATNQFIQARSKISHLRRNYTAEKDAIDNIEIELNTKAVSYYTQKFKSYKEKKFYHNSIAYSDSVLIFSPSDRSASYNKTEMIAILDFLEERKIKTFDFWVDNSSLKNDIINDYKEKCYAFMFYTSKGSISFNLNISTDTNCYVKPSINWKTPSIDLIRFGQADIQKYAILPFEKYSYCANSSGSIPINLDWTKANFKFKYFNGSIKSSIVVASEVKDFIVENYPRIKGNIKYTKTNVIFNNEQSSVYYINSIKTRGPLNSIYSLLIPGLGTYRVTYGQKGIGTFFFFTGGIAASLSGTSNLATVGAAVIATTYLWDLTSTIIKGSKNLKATKELRKRLKNEPIRL